MWVLAREEQLVLLFVAGAFAVGLGIELLGGIPSEPPQPPPPSIRVRVEGAVKEPGWYEIPQGSSVAELIDEAGGALPWADLSGVHLTNQLFEPARVNIPEGKLNVNSASVKDLACLPGIGPELAGRIVNQREKKGGFKDLEELREVSGIGNVRFRKIKDKLKITN